MKQPPPVRLDRLLEREPGQLVPEPHRGAVVAEDPVREALSQVADLLSCQALEEPALAPGRDHRHRVEHGARRWAQSTGAGQDGIANCCGDVLPAGREHLGHVERVPLGPLVQLAGFDSVGLRELSHRLGRERVDVQAGGLFSPGKLTQYDTQHVRRVQLVVPIRRQHQRGSRGFQAPTDQGEHVERGLVRPVQVIEDENRRRVPAQLADQRSRDLVRLHVHVDGLVELASGLRRDVDERAQRPRREERVACAPQHPPRCGLTVTEGAQERGLAHPGLAADQHEPPSGSCRRARERFCECGQVLRSFEELHTSFRRCRRGHSHVDSGRRSNYPTCCATVSFLGQPEQELLAGVLHARRRRLGASARAGSGAAVTRGASSHFERRWCRARSRQFGRV